MRPLSVERASQMDSPLPNAIATVPLTAASCGCRLGRFGSDGGQMQGQEQRQGASSQFSTLETVEEEVLGKAYDGRLMRRLLGYMRPYRKLVGISLLFLLVQSALQVLGPLLTQDRGGPLHPAERRRAHADVPRPAICPPTPGPGSAQHRPALSRRAGRRLRFRVRPDVPDAVHRPARHVRPAPRS